MKFCTLKSTLKVLTIIIVYIFYQNFLYQYKLFESNKLYQYKLFELHQYRHHNLTFPEKLNISLKTKLNVAFIRSECGEGEQCRENFDNLEKLTFPGKCRAGNKTKCFLTAVILVRIYDATDKAKWTKEDLRQWIRYMQFAGVEHIFLYDNYKFKNESLQEWCAEFFYQHELSYYNWSKYHPYTMFDTQFPAYNHALSMGRNTSMWQIQFDMDEYPFAMNDTNPGFLIRFLEQQTKIKPTVAEFSFKNYLFLGKRSNEKYVIEQVLKRTPNQSNSLDKPIIKTECIVKCRVHHNVMDTKKPGCIMGSWDVNSLLLRNNHYWHARLQDWGNDTEKIIKMTVYDPSALAIAKQLHQMGV